MDLSLIVLLIMLVLYLAFISLKHIGPTPNHLKHIHEKLSTASYNSETSSPMEVIQEVLEYIEKNATL